jgi:hypothetical protein
MNSAFLLYPLSREKRGGGQETEAEKWLARNQKNAAEL